jgi:hypothetical protein
MGSSPHGRERSKQHGVRWRVRNATGSKRVSAVPSPGNDCKRIELVKSPAGLNTQGRTTKVPPIALAADATWS